MVISLGTVSLKKKEVYHFPKKSLASTREFIFHCIPTLAGNLPCALCLLLADEPAGEGVGVGLLVAEEGEGVGVGLLVVDPAGEGVEVCFVDGGGVICLKDGGVLTGVFGVEFFLCLKQ